jgi:hypothetical protein
MNEVLLPNDQLTKQAVISSQKYEKRKTEAHPGVVVREDHVAEAP